MVWGTFTKMNAPQTIIPVRMEGMCKCNKPIGLCKGFLNVQGQKKNLVLKTEKGTGTKQGSSKSIKAYKEKTKAAKQYNELMLAQGIRREEILERKRCKLVNKINVWF